MKRVTITLKNHELGATLKFIETMELKAAAASRHRSKFKGELMKAIKGLQEAELAIYDQYGEKDGEGKLIINKARTNYEIKDEYKAQFYKEMNSLLDEEVMIEGGLYARNFAKFGQVLAEYNGVISGNDADIYDRLMDEFEKEENQHVKD
ncbi:DUF1617 family protein [Enterococcus mundtii]|uniref:DUF1617 family protein n=1 Tax=Enterococcus mundtii TaxID=53346 RepID=UPI001377D354|nr:DUF1617 family protein [Enterococcus mundtii]NBA63393.1 DUF1617 family protein [Enterococcus mundtii]